MRLFLSTLLSYSLLIMLLILTLSRLQPWISKEMILHL